MFRRRRCGAQQIAGVAHSTALAISGGDCKAGEQRERLLFEIDGSA